MFISCLLHRSPAPRAVLRCISSSRHIGQPTKQTHPHLFDGDDITPGISQKEYEDRQLFLLSGLPAESTVIVSSSSRKYQSWSVPFDYKQNSSFHYLCGIDQPNLLLVIQKLQRNDIRRCLFMKEKIDNKLSNVSPHLFPEDVKQYFGIQEVYDIQSIKSILQSIIGERKNVYTYTTPDATIHNLVISSLSSLSDRKVESILPYLDRIRWIKSINEQKQLRYSSTVCTNGYNEIANMPWMENRLSSAFEYQVKMRGADGVGFPTVIAGGSNSRYVEYSNNDCIIDPGDNILIDCGVSLNHYNSDMSRVLFAGEMKSENKAKADVYIALTEIYNNCIRLLRSKENITMDFLYNETVREISRLLIELGVLKSCSLETIIEQRLYVKYYPHYIGHYIGLDNNDTPTVSYKQQLTPGVAFTLEPGLYFNDEEDVPEDIRHFGARIEDTILYVDNKNVDILTKDALQITSSLVV